MPNQTIREWFKILVVVTLVVGYILFLASQSEAQPTPSLEHRQTRALEKMADEMEKMRRCQCK